MQLATVIGWLTSQAVGWNLFESPESRLDARQLRIEIISTRIYVFTLTLLTVNLIIYASLMTLTQTMTRTDPSQATYAALYEKYPNTLSCPCKSISIRYEDFTNISVQYHPICTSGFITNAWINQLFDASMRPLDSDAPSVTFLTYFQLLNAFCSTARRTVQNSIKDFFSEVLVTKNLLSSDSLKNHSEEELSFKLNTSANKIQQHYAFLQNMSHSNQFQTMYQTPQSILHGLDESAGGADEHVQFRSCGIRTGENTSCNCVEQSTCSSRAMLFNGNQRGYLQTTCDEYTGEKSEFESEEYLSFLSGAASSDSIEY